MFMSTFQGEDNGKTLEMLGLNWLRAGNRSAFSSRPGVHVHQDVHGTLDDAILAWKPASIQVASINNRYTVLKMIYI